MEKSFRRASATVAEGHACDSQTFSEGGELTFFCKTDDCPDVLVGITSICPFLRRRHNVCKCVVEKSGGGGRSTF